MIKLIAADLDGTLLHTDKSLPADFAETAEALASRGVIFVAASGRQYDNIYATLAPYSAGMYIISENGAINGFGEEIREEKRMTPESVRAVLDAADATGGRARAVCCCAHMGLYSDADEKFARETGRYYLRRERVSPEELRRAPACKIALYCDGRAEEVYRDLPTFPGTQNVISGVDWVDVAPVGVNKGSALESVLRIEGIRPDDCAAFGDNFNDRELLDLCSVRYTVDGAPAGMRALFPSAGSNDRDAVTTAIRRLIGLE